jgi:multidrug resistance efflux pump
LALKIRKEKQDELKASLEAAPIVVAASASLAASASDTRTAEPMTPNSEMRPAKAKTARNNTARNNTARNKASKTRTGIAKATKRDSSSSPRKSSSKSSSKKTGKPRAASAAARKSRHKAATSVTVPAIYRPTFREEIQSVREMFAFLRARTREPLQLQELEKVTLQYLRKQPSQHKFTQVTRLLDKQVVDMMQRDLETHLNAHTVIELPASPVAQTEAIQNKPAPHQPLAAEPKRRRIAAWFARKGGGWGADGPRVPFKTKLRTALMASIWIGVGVATIGYASALYYVNYMRLETDTAMISGTVEPINAPMDGTVMSLLVRVGDRIPEGTRIAVFEDPDVEKLVSIASVKVERSREDLRLKQAEMESEKLKRDEYIQIARSKIEKIDEDLTQIHSQERVARERFERLSELFKKGFVIRPRIEEASDKLAELTAQLAKARINKRERVEMQDNVASGHYFDGSQVVGRLKEAEAAVVRASAEVDLSLEELQVMQKRRLSNRIVATRDMRVMKVLRPEGSSVKRGDTVVVMEAVDSRVVHAFLRQEEIGRITIGDEATVFLPALRAKANARVMAVERNAAFIDDVDARYTWKQARDAGPKPTDRDRTARVTLRFDAVDRAVVDSRFEIGMPTVVSFARRSTSTVFSSFTEVGRGL